MKNKLTDILTPSGELTPLPSGIENGGMILTGIKACIFDIYGTLLISGSGDVGTAMEAGSPESFADAFAKCGIQSVPENYLLSVKEMFFSYIKNKHRLMQKAGYPYPEIDIIELWTEIIGSGIKSDTPEEISGLAPELIAAAYESVVNPVAPMPGAAELLGRLRNRGFKLGIVSNAQFYTPIVIDLLFKGGFGSLGFDESLSLYSYVEKRAKPDTELFIKLSKRLGEYGISPGETVYVGNDMLKDIMPASLCGYKTALFAGDSRSLRLREHDAACSNIKPDVIVNKLTDLLNYIQEG